jgi:hypothetical protein
VVAFENQTMQPRLSEAVVHALRRQLQQDGTYRLATRNDADVLITGRFVNLERASITYSPHDLRTTRDEELRVVARVVARDLRTGTTLLDREVVGRVTVRIGANQTSAERQALPVLAADLASKTVPLLVDGEW